MTTRFIASLSKIARRFDAYLVDVWGVLHDGGSAYPGALECLRRLQGEQKVVIILSNAARREQALACELARFGFHAGLYRGIASSGELTWRALAESTPWRGKRCYYLGPDRSVGILDGLPCSRANGIADCDFILNTGAQGNPETTRAFHELLAQARRRELPMFCANPDRVAVRHGVMGISAGAIAQDYEARGGQVHYFGKPFAPIYTHCFEWLPGINRHRILAIGDGMATDILGGHNAGLTTLLVTNGIHRQEIGDGQNDPDLSALTTTYGVEPDYALPGLQW